MRQKQSFFPFSGGLDLETPAIAMPAGRVIAVRNYMGASSGYQRVGGIERFDGRPAPSAFTFSVSDFTLGVEEFAVGDTITGDTSGATGVVVGVILKSGDWATGDAAGTLALEGIVDTFQSGETLLVGATPVAVLSELFNVGDRQSSSDDMAFWLAGTEARRAAIQKVPGSGPVRGVVWFDGHLHAWRDNADGTAGVGYRSTSTGWEAHSYGSTLAFDTTTGQFTIGETVTGGTSGATGVVRVAAKYDNEEWDSATTGVLILDTVTGTFTDGETLTGGTSGATAKAKGTNAAYSLPPGGRYRFVRENFYGSTGTERVYGVNGVGKGFDFDGHSIVEIPTGMEDDRPFLIATYKKHLFFGFPKGSVQNSALGEPRIFAAIMGANEIGMGSELTNLVPNGADTLLITTANSIAYLSGTSISDFTLTTLSKETGARKDSAAWIGDVLYQDERGIRSVTASQRYGNFTIGTYTQLVQKELTKKRVAGIDPVEAFAIKTADNYILSFNDGSALAVFIGRKAPEPMMLQYPFKPTCYWVDEINGSERIFAGSQEGYVFELEVGPSFDGEPIEAFMQFPFAHQGGPRILKRYHKAAFEIDAPINTRVSVIAQFDYGAGLQPFSQEDVFGLLSGSGGSWDINNWDEFYWDSPLVGQAEAHLQGVGENMSLTVASRSNVMDSHTFQGVTLAFSVRGQIR